MFAPLIFSQVKTTMPSLEILDSPKLYQLRYTERVSFQSPTALVHQGTLHLSLYMANWVCVQHIAIVQVCTPHIISLITESDNHYDSSFFCHPTDYTGKNYMAESICRWSQRYVLGMIIPGIHWSKAYLWGYSLSLASIPYIISVQLDHCEEKSWRQNWLLLQGILFTMKIKHLLSQLEPSLTNKCVKGRKRRPTMDEVWVYHIMSLYFPVTIAGCYQTKSKDQSTSLTLTCHWKAEYMSI